LKAINALAATACLALAFVALPAQALNPTASVWNEGNGLFDVGRTFGQMMLNSWPEERYGGRLVCDSIRHERSGPSIRVSVTVEPTEAIKRCEFFQDVSLGELPAGSYQVEANFVQPDGVVIQQRKFEFEVKARGNVCNVSPENHLVDLLFPNPDTSDFVRRFESDAAFRASLANITIHEPRVINGIGVISAEFDPLADPQRVFAALRGSGEFTLVRTYLPYGCGFALCPGDTTRRAVEYFHAANDRYFFTDEPAEIAALDSGAPRAGWTRTGESFRVVYQYGQALPVEGVVQKVYRFWSPDVSGKPSHFFTVSQQECAALRDGVKRNWTFEGSTFWASVANGDACSAGTPLFRVYNNGLGGAPSHRYTTRIAVVDEMVGKGWVKEGVAMCVAGS
jgi:hypothetical protein